MPKSKAPTKKVAGAHGGRRKEKTRDRGKQHPGGDTAAPFRQWAVVRPGRGQPSAVRKSPGRIFVGTASWTDPGFIADWYPPRLPPQERLPWYAEHFGLVEVNSSFYAVPSPSLTARWAAQTPGGFVFDVKLHRLLSRHSTDPKLLPRDLRPLAGPGKKALLTPELETALVGRILDATAPLAEAHKLGALLLQLSPSFGPRKHRLEELDHLLDLLSAYKVAVELRHRAWVDGERLDETVAFFRKRRVALVAVDAPASTHFMVMPGVDRVTAPRLAYLRAHGRNARGFVSGRSVAERFDYRYNDAELREIAGRATALAGLTAETHVIFNNNKSNYAPVSAQRFREIVAQQAATTIGRDGVRPRPSGAARGSHSSQARRHAVPAGMAAASAQT